MPVFHEDLFEACWVVLCNVRKDSFVLLWFLKECQFPVFKLHFWEGPLNKVLGITLFLLAYAWFKILNPLFKYIFRRVCSKKSQSLAFDEVFFDPWWVARREVRILKCLSRCEVCTHIKNWIASESFAFIDFCIQKCRFCFWNFSRKFSCGVVFVCLHNELHYLLSTCLKCRGKICLYIVPKWAVLMRFGLKSPFQPKPWRYW